MALFGPRATSPWLTLNFTCSGGQNPYMQAALLRSFALGFSLEAARVYLIQACPKIQSSYRLLRPWDRSIDNEVPWPVVRQRQFYSCSEALSGIEPHLPAVANQ